MLVTNPHTFGSLVVEDGVGYDAVDVVTGDRYKLVVIRFDRDRPLFDVPDVAAGG